MEFTLAAKGGLDVSADRPNYPLAADGRAEVTVTGSARKAGDAVLLFAGVFGERRDAVEIKLPVHTGQRASARKPSTEASRGSRRPRRSFLPDAGSALAATRNTSPTLRWRSRSPASPFLRMTEGLRYLLRYPYGCVEQTSSGVMPLAALHRILQQGRGPGNPAGRGRPLPEKRRRAARLHADLLRRLRLLARRPGGAPLGDLLRGDGSRRGPGRRLRRAG